MRYLILLCLLYLLLDSKIAFGICSDLWEKEMTSELSMQRSMPFSCSDQIGKAAQYHANDMCQRNFFSHVSPEGYTAKDRLYRISQINAYYWGETLYRTTNAESKAIVAAWMGHNGYKQVIQDPKLNYVGFGWTLCNGWYLIVANYTN